MIMINVSDEFRKRISSVWGEEGVEWLDQLPTIIAACEERWSLSNISPVPDLSYNYVAQAVKEDRTDVILKIGVPNPELLTEIEALRAFRKGTVVELLEVDLNLGTLVLERVRPGSPLSELRDDEEATIIGAHMMRKIPVPEPAQHGFPSVGDWALAFERLRERFDGKTGLLPARLVGKAERLFKDLQASSPGEMLLHGDLHHYNILSHGEGGWVAIDPKGIIGDPAYEAARFQLNPVPGFLSMDNPKKIAEKRVEIISSILQIDRSRLLAWAFFDTMLSACWIIEDNGDDWQYAVSCAEVLDALVD
jgi:streptomycin 6-kinase